MAHQYMMNIFHRKPTRPTSEADATAANRKQEPEYLPTKAATRDTDSTAPLVTSAEGEPTHSKRRRSSLFKKISSGEKKTYISDSGPYIFAFDPKTGKEILQKNPHWPYEDSWKRENVRDRGETDNTVAPGGLGFGVNNW